MCGVWCFFLCCRFDSTVVMVDVHEIRCAIPNSHYLVCLICLCSWALKSIGNAIRNSIKNRSKIHQTSIKNPSKIDQKSFKIEAGAALGAYQDVLVVSWGILPRFGRVLRRLGSVLGGVLAASWGILGMSWGALGRLLGPLGASRGVLEASWA